MLSLPTSNADLLEHRLWCVSLGGSGLCAAETAEGSFLALFTSSARARQFIRNEHVEESESASPRVYSSSRTEFLLRARSAAADGICGTVVDLLSSGQVREIIPFRTLGISGTMITAGSAKTVPTIH